MEMPNVQNLSESDHDNQKEIIFNYLQLSFAKHGFKGSEKLTLEILKSISRYEKRGNDDNILLKIYDDYHLNFNNDPTIDDFIEDLTFNLSKLDNNIGKLLNIKQQFDTNINKYQSVLKTLRNREYELDIPPKDINTVKIRYVKENIPEIDKNYIINYHASVDEYISAPIKTIDEPCRCTLKISLDTQIIRIAIYKILRDTNIPSNPDIVNIKDLPIHEVYTSLKPESYADDEIKSVFLIIPYEDQDPTSEIGEQSVDLEFKVNLDFEFRVRKLNEIIGKFKFEKMKVEKKIDFYLGQINDIIYPFHETIGYNITKRFYETSRKNDSICQNCQLI